METTLYIYLALYIAILIGVSWYISRRESNEGFLIANRDRKWWTIALSKFAGAIGIGYFVAYTGYAYEYGFGVYLVLLGSFIGYTLFGFWAAPRLYEYSREKKFYTQGDFVAHATKNNTAKQLTNWVANLIVFGWLMVGVVGGAKIISHFGLLSYEISLIATIFIVMSYIFLAGFKAVLATDVLQAIIVFALVAILTWVIIGGVGFEDVLSAQTGVIDIGTTVGFLIFGSLSVFSYSNFYQLIYAAKDKRAASIGIASSIIPIIAVATLLLMIGMFMFLQNPNLDSGLVFLEALASYLPEWLLPVGIVLFFAGLMSSADTNVYAIASHYVLSRKSQRPVYDIRVAIVILSILSVIVGYFFRDLIDVTIVVAAISVILSVGMIYLIAGGSSHYRFVASVVGGVIGFIIGLAVFGIQPTLILPVLVCSLLGLIYNGQLKKHNSERLE